MKGYTDIEQSKRLAEILPLETADRAYILHSTSDNPTWRFDGVPMVLGDVPINEITAETLPCWSLAALLKYLSEIKPQVYTPVLFPSEGKWILQFAEYGHGNVCEVSCDNPIDACHEVILKLNELKML